MRLVFILLVSVYALGIAFGLTQDFLQFRSAGGGDFELVESLTYASFWPLRIVSLFSV